MLYHSTNKKAKELSFKDALIKGLASDKGLYLPNEIPKFSDEEIKELSGKNYAEIAYLVLKKFLGGEVEDDKLKEMVNNAYNFPVPIEKVNEEFYIMRMDQGPTASFKDFSMRIMARLMDYFTNKKLVILTATSGDTGGACAHAFYKLNNIKVVILMPANEISSIQRKQMTTLGKNIFPIIVNGKFDDCQNLVKEAFSDNELKGVNLSSANSINIGRLIPQSVYYFYGYSRLAEPGEKVNFVVPSGNWGNQMGGLMAKRMGLPVDKFVSSVNENDETAKFIKTKKYEKIVPSRGCLSSAMNVGHPSNFARVVELYGGRMDETGKITKQPDIGKMKEDMFIISVTNDETKKSIKQAHDQGVIIEPHGAVGWKAFEKTKDKLKGKTILLETAHPAKFPELLNKIGVEIKLPIALRDLDKKKEEFVNIDINYAKLKEYIKKLK